MASESSAMAVIRASRPSFRNRHDKVAFAVHAAFLAAGYALTATGKSALAGRAPSGDEEVGIEGWNECDDCYAFVFLKEGKSGKMRVLVKCLEVGDVLAVDVLRPDKDQKEPFNLQMKVKDYVPEKSSSTGNYGDMYRNFKDLVGSVNKSILAKLEPPRMASSSSSAARLIYPPVLDTDFNDVYPGPGAGFFPQRGSSSGGSMLVGPNDPRFGRIGRPDHGFPGGFVGIPPGARYDPIGPPHIPGFEPARFVRPPRRPGGRTHPDLEHFPGSDYI